MHILILPVENTARNKTTLLNRVHEDRNPRSSKIRMFLVKRFSPHYNSVILHLQVVVIETPSENFILQKETWILPFTCETYNF